MEKKYLTISEFAKLRNVSIGSLRYYEQLKILCPAKIDPHTKYRYYLPEQLATLDTILLCIELNIPLKDLDTYIDSNGYLNQKKILATSKQAMMDKIMEMQMKLEITQYSMNSMERNQKYTNQKGVYTREIDSRSFLEVPLGTDWKNLYKKEQMPLKLFHEAQEKKMSPIFPASIILHYEDSLPQASFCLQVLHPDNSDKRILHLPKAEYLCFQTDLTFETNLKELLEKNFGEEDKKTIIISNMIQKKMHFHSRHSEIQMPLSK